MNMNDFCSVVLEKMQSNYREAHWHNSLKIGHTNLILTNLYNEQNNEPNFIKICTEV